MMSRPYISRAIQRSARLNHRNCGKISPSCATAARWNGRAPLESRKSAFPVQPKDLLARSTSRCFDRSPAFLCIKRSNVYGSIDRNISSSFPAERRRVITRDSLRNTIKSSRSPIPPYSRDHRNFTSRSPAVQPSAPTVIFRSQTAVICVPVNAGENAQVSTPDA